MNKLILCEGKDDNCILGYYLFKSSNEPKWMYNKKTKLSANFQLITNPNGREIVEIYVRGNESKDKTAIWSVGGKDCFEEAIGKAIKICKKFPLERFEDIVIVTDRDDEEIGAVENRISAIFNKFGWDITLRNHTKNNFEYQVEDRNYSVNISPVIIPLDQNGALETILMNGYANVGDNEDKLIVSESIRYIDDLVNSTMLHKHLTKDRMKLKAKFSTMISVINPDHSTRALDDILMCFEWEKSPYIQKQFSIIEDIFK